MKTKYDNPIFLFIILVTIIFLPIQKIVAQPACEWDQSDECCGRIVPCNGGTYGPTGNECLGSTAPSLDLCPF